MKQTLRVVHTRLTPRRTTRVFLENQEAEPVIDEMTVDFARGPVPSEGDVVTVEFPDYGEE